MLRTVLPLLQMPAGLDEARVAFCIDSPADVLAESDGEVIGATLESGAAWYAPEAVPAADAWVRGTVAEWLDLLFDRPGCEPRGGGAPDLVAACLDQLRGAFAAKATPAAALT